MSDRILVRVTDLLALAGNDAELESQLTRELREVADELNSSLAEYETSLMHLDCEDYLCFRRLPSPDEGSYWAELAEEREEQEEAAE